MSALFCARCSGVMAYDAATGRVGCARCDAKSSGKDGKAAAPKRRAIPLTEAQKAIRAAHAPKRRPKTFSGGKGILKPEDEPEDQIQAQIANRLTAEGWLVVRINSGASTSASGSYLRAYRIWGMPKEFEASGAPDLWALRGTRALLIEVKDRRGYLRDSQCRFIEHAGKFRVRVHVCRSWEEAQALVDAIARSDDDKPTREQWERLMALKVSLGVDFAALLSLGERLARRWTRAATADRRPDEPAPDTR